VISTDGAGISTPTVYAYFDSKNAIFDAMFGRAATEFVDWMTEPFDVVGPADELRSQAHRFVEFCTNDVDRYQLLFQRTIPNFEPSAKSYAPAIRALAKARECLALNGIKQARQLDLWTALLSGIVDQQISNDLGGNRWSRLVDEAVTMFLGHSGARAPARKPKAKSSTKEARS